MTKSSLASIGSQIGQRDHATVLHACKTVGNLTETDKQFKSQMIFCTTEGHKMKWANPTDKQVETFMKDYRKDFLNVSTIMKFQELR